MRAFSTMLKTELKLPLLVSDYRHKKILKRFKVTPISPAMILAVHFVIYMIYAVASLILIYMTAAFFFEYYMVGLWPHFLGSYFLTMLSIFNFVEFCMNEWYNGIQ